MAVPKKSTGSGTVISISEDNSTFTEFGSVSKCSAPSFKRDTSDASDLNSIKNNNQMKETLPTWIEAEEMSLEGFITADDTGRTKAEDAFWSGKNIYIKAVLPDVLNKTVLYHGFVSSYQSYETIDPETPLGFKLGFTIIEKPTETATNGG